MYFDNPSEAVGSSFLIGQTVDLCSREYGTGRECVSPDPRVQIATKGTATYEDEVLRIEVEKEFKLGSSLAGRMNQAVVIRFFDCNACKVLDATLQTNPPQPQFDYYLSESISCQIVEGN